MIGEANKEQIATTLAYGLLGAGLVYLARRSRPGFLASLAATAGYGMITRAVSAAVVTALSPTES
jgi:hypothetical protein